MIIPFPLASMLYALHHNEHWIGVTGFILLACSISAARKCTGREEEEAWRLTFITCWGRNIIIWSINHRQKKIL